VDDKQDGHALRGVEAVIDKDLTAAILAREVHADTLVIATDVAHVMVDFGTPSARPLGRVTAAELREHAAAGQFARGSMGPKGNGGINDYTRIIADRAFREVLVEKGSRPMAEVKEIPIVWSGGTDGVISPHATIFATLPEDDVETTDEPRLTVGYAMSDVLLP